MYTWLLLLNFLGSATDISSLPVWHSATSSVTTMSWYGKCYVNWDLCTCSNDITSFSCGGRECTPSDGCLSGNKYSYRIDRKWHIITSLLVRALKEGFIRTPMAKTKLMMTPCMWVIITHTYSTLALVSRESHPSAQTWGTIQSQMQAEKFIAEIRSVHSGMLLHLSFSLFHVDSTLMHSLCHAPPMRDSIN